VLYTLDAVGNRIRQEQQLWKGTGWSTFAQKRFEYLNRCQVQKTITGLPGEGSVTEYAFDCSGNLERIRDPNHPSAGQVNPPSTVYSYEYRLTINEDGCFLFSAACVPARDGPRRSLLSVSPKWLDPERVRQVSHVRPVRFHSLWLLPGGNPRLDPWTSGLLWARRSH
jgi:hypothetical protein